MRTRYRSLAVESRPCGASFGTATGSSRQSARMFEQAVVTSAPTSRCGLRPLSTRCGHFRKSKWDKLFNYSELWLGFVKRLTTPRIVDMPVNLACVQMLDDAEAILASLEQDLKTLRAMSAAPQLTDALDRVVKEIRELLPPR